MAGRRRRWLSRCARSRQESRKLLAALFPLFYRLLGSLSDYPIPLNAGIFSLMSRKCVDSVNALGERNRYLPGLRAWVGYRNKVVYYDRQDRLAGDGKLSFISRIKYAMDAINQLQLQAAPPLLCALHVRLHNVSSAAGFNVLRQDFGSDRGSGCGVDCVFLSADCCC